MEEDTEGKVVQCKEIKYAWIEVFFVPRYNRECSFINQAFPKFTFFHCCTKLDDVYGK